MRHDAVLAIQQHLGVTRTIRAGPMQVPPAESYDANTRCAPSRDHTGPRWKAPVKVSRDSASRCRSKMKISRPWPVSTLSARRWTSGEKRGRGVVARRAHQRLGFARAVQPDDRPRPIGRASGVIHEGSVPRDVERVPSVTTVPGALYNLLHAQLCPGNDALQKLQQQFR